MKILNGKIVRDSIAAKMVREIKKLQVQPKLVIIQVGNDVASSVYVRQKKLFGEKLGFFVEYVQYEKGIAQNELTANIADFNSRRDVHGIIVQLPLPKKLDALAVIEAIDPKKDVDGMHSENLRLLLEGRDGGFVPATTKGILSLLDFYKLPIAGKKVVIVGRSLLVGRPTALALLNRDATVLMCHSKTKNLSEETKSADILIVAIGKPHFITKKFVKAGQVIIDVGISRVEGGIFGDVDFASVSKIARAITPVPGGVGPMTVVSLFENVLLACRRQQAVL